MLLVSAWIPLAALAAFGADPPQGPCAKPRPLSRFLVLHPGQSVESAALVAEAHALGKTPPEALEANAWLARLDELANRATDAGAFRAIGEALATRPPGSLPGPVLPALAEKLLRSPDPHSHVGFAIGVLSTRPGFFGQSLSRGALGRLNELAPQMSGKHYDQFLYLAARYEMDPEALGRLLLEAVQDARSQQDFYQLLSVLKKERFGTLEQRPRLYDSLLARARTVRPGTKSDRLIFDFLLSDLGRWKPWSPEALQAARFLAESPNAQAESDSALLVMIAARPELTLKDLDPVLSGLEKRIQGELAGMEADTDGSSFIRQELGDLLLEAQSLRRSRRGLRVAPTRPESPVMAAVQALGEPASLQKGPANWLERINDLIPKAATLEELQAVRELLFRPEMTLRYRDLEKPLPRIERTLERLLESRHPKEQVDFVLAALAPAPAVRLAGLKDPRANEAIVNALQGLSASMSPAQYNRFLEVAALVTAIDPATPILAPTLQGALEDPRTTARSMGAILGADMERPKAALKALRRGFDGDPPPERRSLLETAQKNLSGVRPWGPEGTETARLIAVDRDASQETLRALASDIRPRLHREDSESLRALLQIVEGKLASPQPPQRLRVLKP